MTPFAVESFIQEVLAEDIGRGDLFSRVGEGVAVHAYIIAKSEGVFAGEVYLEAAAKRYGLGVSWNVRDGESFRSGKELVRISGDSKTILMLERTLLNIVLHASSIATNTAKFVKAIEGSDVVLLDTRKTRPLLRTFEKYAVRCGGGVNHRMGLDDCLMLKDTHLATIGDLKTFIAKARRAIPYTAKIEVECERLEQAQEAMEAGADIVMCDNMPLEEIKKTVALRDSRYPGVLLEASGNVTLETIGELARTGVDAISSGSIIHQACWIDLSMKIKSL